MLKVSNIRLALSEPEERLSAEVARALGVRQADIVHLRILRKSLDVRDHDRPQFVYTAAAELAAGDSGAAFTRAQVSVFQPAHFEEPIPGTTPLEHPPVVIGAGPAGLFCALYLAEYGYAPILIERGKAVHDRVDDVRAFDEGGPLDPESNYLYGEGGAGTFSDGKLTCRNTGPDTDRVLERLAECKGKASIVYEARPHLGSNRLPAVVKALRRRILAAGGRIRFGCRLDDLQIDQGRLVGLSTSAVPLPTNLAVLAIGHSARDTYQMLLARGVAIEPRAFQMGLRIEQPQEQVTRCRYGTGPAARLLGPADYALNVRVGERDVFTFCMCAGGYVMPSVSQEGFFCTNGMSRSRHESPFANSGVVLTVDPRQLSGFESDPLAGIRYQAAIERAAFRLSEGTYHAPIQWARDFLDRRTSTGRLPTSYQRGVFPSNLWEFLPADVASTLADGLRRMDERWKGAFLKNATVVGPEARGSCPVRIVRDDVTRESLTVRGLYPVGEGAGYAGGIVSAAVDGLRTARTIISAFRPLR